ncbi:N-acetyltransferase 10 [Trichinella spiralis]|uniref:RNA cytidine acetyltransferase n=1 Tax=Trichinella spiralis TaxID=6334 RepID=A0A0V1BVC3_TRISP|nr:N-acetyltransferase 10 [Trichinella spiralis]
MHAFMFSVSSRAIPHSLYSMNAYSTQSFRMTNEKENRTTFCRFHFTAVPNENPLKSQLITNDVSCQSVDDLSQQAVDEIAKGNFLTWRVDIQIFTAAEVAYLPFDAFDSTKVWPHKLSPLVPVGKVVLNKVVHHSTEFTGSNSTIGCMPVCKAASTTEELELTDTDDNGRILTDDACSKKLLTADECQTMDPFWQPGILWRTIFDENERDQVATRIAQYIRPISSPIMTSVLDLFAQVDEELLGVVVVVLVGYVASNPLPTNDICDIFCHGPLLDVIQKSRLFQDSKYFVDMALLYDPDVVLQAFETVENKTDPKALDMFIKKYFSPPGSELKECQPVDWVPRPKSFLKIADEHFRLWAYFVHGKWKKLCREVTDQVKTEPNRFTFISVPHPFIIPGGRFREFYYWDTYWILKGLLASEMYETARNMILNFATIIDQFGFVPNGGRIYYKNRSQPPLLTMSVWDYYQATKDKAVLVNMLPRLEKELQFWYKNRGFVYKDENGKTLQLHQYRVDTDLPRAESYTEDLASASLEFTEAGKRRIWSDIVSACESGIDFGTRWFRRDGDLNKTVRSIRTRRIVPVDLQAILCGSEAVLSRLYNVLGDQTMAEVHQKKYQRMKEDLHDAFWDPIDKMWYDIDLDERDGRGAKSPTFYPSNLAPLYFDCVLNDKKKVGQQIAKYLEENGISSMPYGIPSSMHASDEQWDRPNGWAPHNHMVIEGLRKSGDIFAQQIAFKVAQNWIDGVWFVFFQYAGKMFEKYRVEGHYGIGGGGEYTVQEGFGWTNGVILDLLMTYGEELKREGPYPNYAIKIDSRIRVLIENGIHLGHRSLLIVIGEKAREQVAILHHLLSKATVRARPSVLWCYKKELGFSSHRKKRMKLIMKKLRAGKASINEENQFELFISSTEIRYCYYSETHKILGNTYGMCVLQDFEAMTPNLLARTIETVEGGGLVVILLHSLHSIRQLHAMTMDVHSRYRTEAHQDVVARFNERFLLSLASCKTCLLLDDELNVLPLSSAVSAIDPASAEAKQKVASNATELKQLIESMSDAPTVGKLLKQCKTLDQAKVILKLFDVISENNLKHTVSLTAARGRGKSAALGLAAAGAIGFGYSNIFVTSPGPENLKTFFQFVCKGFDALQFEEHIDYEVVQSINPEFNKAVVRINVTRGQRQTIQYIHPTDAIKLGQAELVIIDEAAAIPLLHVKQLLGPYLVFISSTVNGYEGTGRSLSLKLLQELREQSSKLTAVSKSSSNISAENFKFQTVGGRTLSELTLSESIRYKPGDDVELWLNQLLCLDVTTIPKNSPNDLQMMSDAPAHHLFVLLGPFVQNSNNIPEILCVVQVCLEGDLSKASVHTSLTSGKRPSGDLIPWTLVQQFQDEDFPSLCGARIVRIATHPDYQRMGYGLRAVQLLQRYYEGKFPALDDPTTSAIDIVPIEFNMSSHNNEKRGLLDEHVSQRKKLPPLLSRLCERSAERLDWIGVSYGLTETLQRFWARSQFFPVYIRQIANELTGEYSCIMLKTLNTDQPWLIAYWTDFRRRFISLLSNPFSHFPAPLALGILAKPNLQMFNAQAAAQTTPLDRKELAVYFTNHDLKRIEMYSRNLIDHHLIVDLVPSIGKLYFLGKLNINLNAVEVAILLAFGLQLKNVADLGKELKLQSAQVLALFNRIIIKSIQCMNEICESAVECEFGIEKQPNLQIAGLQRSLDEELNEYAEEEKEKADRQLSIQLSESELKMYRIEAVEQSMLENVEQRTVTTGKRKLFKKAKSSKKRPRKQNVQV